MKKLYTTQNVVFLQIIKAKLAEEQIQFLVKNENAPLAGEIPSMIVPPELWILQDEQLPHAEKIVQEAVQSQSEAIDWECPGCGEKLSSQFNMCWNCNAART